MRAIKAIFWLAALPLWVVGASAAYLWSASRLDLFVFPYWQWFMAAPYYTLMPVRVALAAFTPFAVIMLTAFLLQGGPSSASRRLRSRVAVSANGKLTPVERANTDNHGHAAWQSPRELKAKFAAPSPYHGAKIVGRIPGGGLLYDNCLGRSGISLEFSGTRSGKTTQIASTIAHWEYPQVVLDPKCEIGPMMWRYLTAKGHRVYIVNPDPSPVDPAGNPVPWKHLITRFNPLDWIDIHHPLASSYVSTFASYFFDPHVKRDANSDFFREEARNMISAILADILWSDCDPASKTLAALRAVISLDRTKLRAALTDIHRSSRSKMARDLAGPLIDSAEEAAKQFAGVHEEAARATAWLANPALADMVSGSGFHTREITGADPVVVILQKPMHVLLTYPGLARALFGSLMNAKIASGTVTKTLFIPDECWLLGKLEALRIALVAGSGHGIVLHMPWQSLGQMEEIWGQDGRKTWLDNAAYYTFSSPRDPAVAKQISDACGTYGVVAYSEGNNSGVQGGTGFFGRYSRGKNLNRHEIKRQLIAPHEVIQDLRPREDVVLLGVGKPGLIQRAPWMEIPHLRDEIERSPYEEEVA